MSVRQGRYQKCVSTLVDPEHALFEYLCLTCGHRWRSVLKVGPRGQRKPASADTCRLMARVWSGYQRMNAHCPKCEARIKAKLPFIGPKLPLY